MVEKLISDLTSPLYLTFSPHDSQKRLYIVEQDGKIKIFQNGILQEKPFLDITSQVKSGGEMGLLGLAFHPKFQKNKKFYINYTTKKNKKLKTRISEFKISSKTKLALPHSERILLEFEQPYANHNGGHLIFGPEGHLYIGTGDGGSRGDPHGHGQNLNTLLGKMLRIQVKENSTYDIPPDNPFIKITGAKKEIWAYGLRNPWRYSFDRKTRSLYVADVGQDEREEIHIIQKGGNYGWNVMEGSHCFHPPQNCNTQTLELPIAEYSHQEGLSITGGYVYRAKKIPSLQGIYIFGDYISGKIWGIRYDSHSYDGKLLVPKLLLETNFKISSFGEDEDGELYVIDHRGSVYLLKEKEPKSE